MIDNEYQMLSDFESLIAIGSTVEEALAEIVRVYDCSLEQAHSSASAKFGDLDAYAWKSAFRK